MAAKPPYDPATVKFLLKRNNLKQSDIARELGVTDAAVSRVLNGQTYSNRIWAHFQRKVKIRRAG